METKFSLPIPFFFLQEDNHEFKTVRIFVNIKVFLKAWWFFIHKKEWRIDTFYNMDEPSKHYVKWKKPDTKGYTLYDSIYMKDTE